MAEYTISAANLSAIERNLSDVGRALQNVDSRIDSLEGDIAIVGNNVKVVFDDVTRLAADFHDFVNIQVRANRKVQAQADLNRVRAELNKKYGHYDQVRRTSTGILQATDLAIVKQSTITNAAEELMISTPNYWLAPCLVALAAWINDKPDVADRAIREGIKRNDEKTSLFFGLVCRRADRKSASLKWIQRYLEMQNEENLDRKTIVILDAFAGGLLGADSEGIISRQIDSWMERLESKPGFIEQQRDQWAAAIELKRQPLDNNGYIYLPKYSHTWPVLKDIMEGAYLHGQILEYFMDIFNQEASTESLKVQLDEILTSLVSDYDDEELPLRKQEKFNQFIIDYDGDEARAKSSMNIEQTAFETHKDFTQLLTDAAMKPESSHSSVSTQKFAIALSKDWIIDAYKDVDARNNLKIPSVIEVNVDNFNDVTSDGRNQDELLGKWHNMINNEKAQALSKCELSSFDQFCLYGGAVIGFVGLLCLCFGPAFLGLLALIAGVGLVIKHFSTKKQIEQNKANIEQSFEEKRNNGAQIIVALLAEVIDFWDEFLEKNDESQTVIDYLEDINSEQYINKLTDSSRRVRIKT